MLEQLLLLFLIVGRWMLPKGDLTHDQLSPHPRPAVTAAARLHWNCRRHRRVLRRLQGGHRTFPLIPARYFARWRTIQSIAMSICSSACLFFCPLPYPRNHTKLLWMFSRGSVLLLRRCDTLCTSGFVDDVMSYIMSVI